MLGLTMPKKTKPIKTPGAGQGIGASIGHQQLRIELAAVSLAAQFGKLVAKAAHAGLAVVVDADTIAIRLIPRAIVDRGDDLRQLGDVVRVHGACGGMTGSGGGHPHGVY